MAFAREKVRKLKKRHTIYRLLADWYGTERAANEIAAHTAQPRAIGDILNGIASEIISADAADFAKLDAAWKEIAGKTIARLAKPVACDNKTIVLGVRHSAMVTELRPSLDLIREKINRVLGEGFCRDVRLTVI